MKTCYFFLLILLSLAPVPALKAQGLAAPLSVDMTGVDGIELRPDNIFNYRINNLSQQSLQATVRGRVQFRRSRLGFSYSFQVLLQPGSNNIGALVQNASWTYTDNALRELFQTYHKLPQGTYEYCVSVQGNNSREQRNDGQPDACVYNTVEDIFLISLVSPENDAKLHEYNPILSWTVTYPFASQLSYRLRVTELKKGQTPATAITRNNPIYQDSHVMGTGAVYPVTARPLQAWQPYAWTVDAYYKGILLGGAEAWKFTIVEDSLLKSAGFETFFVDIRREQSATTYYAAGKVKLKYVLDELQQEALQLRLYDSKGKRVKLQQDGLQATLGDNRFEIDLAGQAGLNHMGRYELVLTNSKGQAYKLLLTYINPDLIP